MKPVESDAKSRYKEMRRQERSRISDERQEKTRKEERYTRRRERTEEIETIGKIFSIAVICSTIGLTIWSVKNPYSFGNVFYPKYKNRPGISIKSEAVDRGYGSSIVEHYKYLVTARARADNATLSRFELYENDRFIGSISLTDKLECVGFDCGHRFLWKEGPMWDRGKPKSNYRIKIKDSLGNVGERKFSSYATVDFLGKRRKPHIYKD